MDAEVSHILVGPGATVSSLPLQSHPRKLGFFRDVASMVYARTPTASAPSRRDDYLALLNASYVARTVRAFKKP